MKHLLITTLVLLFGTIIKAQPPGGGRGMGGGGNMPRPAIGILKVKIQDREGKAVPFASVALLKMRDSSLATGGISDGEGVVNLEKIPVGAYKIRISSVGFITQKLGPYRFTPEVPLNDLGVITLLPSGGGTTKAVEVTAERPFMTMEADKKVYNVDKMLVSRGGSATDILQNIPSVNVDVDGNISLRGTSNLIVLIDGKPSGMTGSSRQAVLDQIPASTIESVEVITNPGAKYDPDGMGGIINLVLKKNRLEGTNITTTVSAGTRDKYNASVVASRRNKKLNSTASYSFRYNPRYLRGDVTRRNFFADTAFSTNQINRGQWGMSNHVIRLSSDYQISTKQSIGASLMGSVNERFRPETITYEFLDEEFRPGRTNYRSSKNSNRSQNIDANINYRLQFEKPKQELTASANLSWSPNWEDGDFTQNNQGSAAGLPILNINRQQNHSVGYNRIFTVQSDYIHPFSEKVKMEMGVKSIKRKVDTDFYAENLNPTDNSWYRDTLLNNHFVFEEWIASAYATIGGRVNRFGWSAGLRAERSETKATQLVNGFSFRRVLPNLFPNVQVSYQVTEQQNLQLTFSRRIDRPDLRSINPITDYSDPLNLRVGNPKLFPEYIHNSELSHSWEFGGITWINSFYYRQITNITQWTRIVRPDAVSIVSWNNVATGSNSGWESIFRAEISEWWNITPSFNIWRQRIKGNAENVGNVDRGQTTWSGKLMSNLRIKKKWDVQFSGSYMAPTISAQGTMRPIYGIDLGLARDFWNKAANLSLNVTDIFDTRQMEMSLSGANFQNHAIRKRETRVATLTFTYRVGGFFDNQNRRRQGGGGGDEGGSGGGMDFGG